ncbi:MAG: hypothetical protein L3J91_02090, partial [Thermoplasmata archaeon]|nr:hypothetical protein [Thermoplasmata archaeon]
MSGTSPPVHRDLQPTALAVFLGGALLLALAVLTGDPLPIFAGLPLVMGPVAALAAAPRGTAAVDLTWRVEGGGADVTIRGSVRPRGDLRVENLSLRFFRPLSLTELRPPKLTPSDDAIDFELAWRAPFPVLAILAPP